VNHNGNIELAKGLVDAAEEAGADLIKFQTFNAERLVTANAPKANYQQGGESQSQFEMLRQLELSQEMHQILISYCACRSIRFFSTAFDIESVNYLSALGAERFKIPSGEITNMPYLRHVGALGKPVIMSTGMATLGEVEEAIQVLESVGMQRTQITVLHCSSAYPTPPKEVNLRAMCTIRDAFGVSVGYSDHSTGTEVAIAAVALGASVIEKHLTLDHGLPGPDHRSSLEPAEFSKMLRSIRNIELALGDGIKRPTPSEQSNKKFVRKSLYATRTIRAGERFTVDNVSAKRPALGLSPMRWDEVVGRRATRDFAADEVISI